MWMLILLACTQSPDPIRDPSPITTPAPVPSGVEALPDPAERRYAASHILVAFKGAVDAPAQVLRTEASAETLAKEILRKAEHGDFASLADAHSDDASGRRGGQLGVYPTGTMVPDFEKAVASVQPGEIGPLVRTPFGWHIVRRDAIEEVEVQHILFTHAGSLRSRSTRSVAEAMALATAIEQRLANGESFDDIAKEVSEDEVAHSGGWLGRVARGQMVPAFEDAAFALRSGEQSGVVQTPYGFHLIRRR